MKLNKIILFIVLFLSIFILTGCQSSNQNVENFYYVVAIGIDKSENSTLNLSIQLASLSDSSGSSDSAQSSSSSIYNTECNSFENGVSIFNNYLSKKLNFSHCSAIIFSEEFAKDGIGDYINIFANNPEIRPTCKVIISDSEAEKTLECISNSHENFSAKLYEFIINSSEYTGFSINPELNDVFYTLTSNAKNMVATYARISEDNILQNTGVAIFDGDKFIDSLCVIDSICYSIITNQLNSCVLSIREPINRRNY